MRSLNIFSNYLTKSKNKEEILPVYELLFWIVLSSIFPLFSGLFSFSSQLYLILFLFSAYCSGRVILGKINSFIKLGPLILTGIRIVFGSFILSLFFLISSYNLIVYFFPLFWLFINVKRLKLNFNPAVLKHVVTLLPFAFFLILPHEYRLSTSIFKGFSLDYSYYTAIVESLKVNQNFGNAIFQSGVGINYQSLSFCIPAQIASFANIPSQIALWGVFMNMISVLAFGTLSSTIVLIYERFLGVLTYRRNLFILITSILLVFLGPLHLINLFKGNIREVLFLGQGYLLPLGSPGFAFSILWMSLLFLMAFRTPKPSLNQSILAICFILLIAGSKVALWAPVLFFLGVYSFLKVITKKTAYSIRWFLTFTLGGVLSLLLIYKLILKSAAPTILRFQWTGQNTNELIDVCKKFGLNSSNFWLLLSIGLGVRLIFFIGSKVLLVSFLGYRNIQERKYKKLFLSIGLTFVIFVFIYLFLNSFALNLDGSIYRDMTFDNGQYLRSVIFILNIFIIIYLLSVFKEIKYLKNKLTVLVLGIWVVICGISYYHLNVKNENPMSFNDSKWYAQVEKDFKRSKPKLMIMLSDGYYSGLGLTAMGISPWYIFGSYSVRDGYSNDYETLKRRKLVIEFFNEKNSLAYRKNLMNRLIEAGVDCIVGNPTYLNKINEAIEDKLILKNQKTNWFYKFN